MGIVKRKEDLANLRECGARLAYALSVTRAAIKAGMTTLELDAIASAALKKCGAAPAFLGYRSTGAHQSYPAASCISLNSTIVHGLPSDEVVEEGDIVSVDLGALYRGWYTDSAFTAPVGNVSKDAMHLITATEEALSEAINIVRCGKTIGDIGHAIQKCAEGHGFSVVKTLTGHGIGRRLHEEPWVYNEGRPGSGEEITSGLVIAIEPMVAIGKGDVVQSSNDSFVTKDGSLAAHFEHTILITKNGAEVLTDQRAIHML